MEKEKSECWLLKSSRSGGVENYFTDSLLYQDSSEAAKEQPPEDSDSSNEANVELEPEDECLWELNPFVMITDKFTLITLPMLKASGLLMKT